jgi:hypothetical protein
MGRLGLGNRIQEISHCLRGCLISSEASLTGKSQPRGELDELRPWGLLLKPAAQMKRMGKES